MIQLIYFRFAALFAIGFALLAVAMPISADVMGDCGPPAAVENPLYNEALGAKGRLEASAVVDGRKRQFADQWIPLETTQKELQTQAEYDDAECSRLKAAADVTLDQLQACKAQCDQSATSQSAYDACVSCADSVNAELAQRETEYTTFMEKTESYNNRVLDWENRLNVFIADVNAAMSASTSTVVDWSGNWDKQEKTLVQNALLGLKDEGIRNWISANVQFNRSKSDGVSPLSAGDSALKFKDEFFTGSTSAKHENLIAFEAGKAFWIRMKDESVEGNKSLMTWFAGFSAGHGGVINDMKAAKHRGEGFGQLGDIGAPSQFAYIFRAQALQLNKPKEQKTQQEWDEVIREFQTRISQFLKN